MCHLTLAESTLSSEVGDLIRELRALIVARLNYLFQIFDTIVLAGFLPSEHSSAAIFAGERAIGWIEIARGNVRIY